MIQNMKMCNIYFLRSISIEIFPISGVNFSLGIGDEKSEQIDLTKKYISLSI